LGKLGFFINPNQEKGDGIMKGKVLMTVMVGLLLLSPNISGAEMGGMPDCTNKLNFCMASWGACTNTLSICTTNLTNEQNNVADALTNLATCQANLAECSQKVPPPSWYQKFPCEDTSNCPRFEVLADWNNEAVLDKETGLVWKKSPSTTIMDWRTANSHCMDMSTGGRSGWRLPTVQELKSLVDKSQSSPALPAGHPFNNVLSSYYWSATTYAYNTITAWTVYFFTGNVSVVSKSDFSYVWCVRGGQGVEAQ
jgi:hypothetical protein